MVCAAHNKTNARNKLNLNAYVSQTVQQITTKLHSQHKYTTTLIRFRRRRSCLSSPTVPAESRPLGGGGGTLFTQFFANVLLYMLKTLAVLTYTLLRNKQGKTYYNCAIV